MRNRNFTIKATLAAMACTACVNLSAQQKEYPQPEKMTPGMSEYWTPQPKIVTPGDIKTNSAPSDAIVLFDGKDLSAWESTNGQPAQWTVHDGVFTVNKKTGDIQTKQKFNNYQLHIEWCVPENITGTSQGRGNSGIFMQGMYEVQILDCYNNETYVNGQTGSIYKQTPPWQTPCVNRANGMYTTSSTPPRFSRKTEPTAFLPASPLSRTASFCRTIRPSSEQPNISASRKSSPTEPARLSCKVTAIRANRSASGISG